MIKHVVTALKETTQKSFANDMETESEHHLYSNSLTTSTQSQPLDLPAIIQELKQDIATITTELQTTTQSSLPWLPTSIKWIPLWTSAGLLCSFRLREITLKIQVCVFCFLTMLHNHTRQIWMHPQILQHTSSTFYLFLAEESSTIYAPQDDQKRYPIFILWIYINGLIIMINYHRNMCLQQSDMKNL